MKKNSNLILLGLLVFLVAATWLYNGPIQKWQLESKQPKNFFRDLNFSSIEKIRITTGGKEQVLVKTGENWRIEGKGDFSVSKSAITELMDTINKARTASVDVISTQKGKKASFGLDDKAVKVVFETKDSTKLDFMVGRIASDYLSSYVSRANDDNTYKFAAVPFAVFQKPDWRDLAIFNLAGQTASYLRLQYPGHELKLESKGANWQSGKDKYRQDKVAEIINSFLTLTALQIPEQNFKATGLEKPLVIAQVKGSGFDKTLIVGNKKGSTYYAKTGDSDNIYLIDKSLVNLLISGPVKVK